MSHENEASGAWRAAQRSDGLRVPPNSASAEQSVLGGLMLRGDALHDVADLLTEGDFYHTDHRLIFRAIRELADKGRPFDAVTLGEWFESMGLADQVAGGSYLIELASTTPSAANIVAYAEIVRDKARLRRMIEVGTNLVNDGFDPNGRDSVEIIGQAQTAIGSLLESQPCELEEMSPVLNRMFESLQRRYELGGAIDGLSTGLTELDRILNGLAGGRIYYIAARPKMGKTTLALNIAEHVAVVEGKPVSVFSFEMMQEELAGKLTCSLGRIEHDRFRTGQLEDADWALAAAAIAKLKRAPIRLSRPRNARIESVCAQFRRLHAKKPQSLLIVDYLQLLEVSSGDQRTNSIGDISRKLKMLAVELNIPVVVLSQLNRKLEERPNKRPIPSDLRDSGAIEQDADAVIFLYRDEVYNENSPDRGTTEIDVALQRNGAPGMVRVATRLNVCRFDNLSHEWSRPEMPQQQQRSRSGFRRSGRDNAAGRE